MQKTLPQRGQAPAGESSGGMPRTFAALWAGRSRGTRQALPQLEQESASVVASSISARIRAAFSGAAYGEAPLGGTALG